jgi:hypothetical protein
MQDIRRVFSDYLEYLDYTVDAMDNMYRNINAMPLVAYTKHAMNIIEEKVRICGFLVWFGMVYLFIHSVMYVTTDTLITDNNLQHNL